MQKFDWQLIDNQCAQSHWQPTGQITVIIQDGASCHRSKAVQTYWQQWQEMGLFISFLPPYSPR